MQYQIRDPEEFAEMLCTVIGENRMPEIVMLRK